MKRIINGVTYNTDTATRVARSEWNVNNDTEAVGTLYQTKGGGFFVHIETTEDRGENLVRKHEFEPMTRDEAQAWVLEGQVELLADNVFPEPPEPDAEEAPATTTVYLRIPSSLKQRAEAAAKAGGQSLNSWALRCMERCLERPVVAPAEGGE